MTYRNREVSKQTARQMLRHERRLARAYLVCPHCGFSDGRHQDTPGVLAKTCHIAVLGRFLRS